MILGIVDILVPIALIGVFLVVVGFMKPYD